MTDEHDFDRRLRDVLKDDPRYPADAYEFVSEAVSYATRKLRKREESSRHISGRELLESLRELALERFGPLALDVLQEWNIYRTEDFGAIVFNLVGHKLLGASEDDRPEDFANGYDFREAFVTPFVENETPPEDLPKIA